MIEDQPWGLNNSQREARGWRPIGRPKLTDAQIAERARDKGRERISNELAARGESGTARARFEKQIYDIVAKWDRIFAADRSGLKVEP